MIKTKKNNYSEINYTKADAISAILIYIYILVLTYLFGIFIYKTSINNYMLNFFKNKDLYKIIIQLPILTLEILPILLILKKLNQPLTSIGIYLKTIKKPILLGVLFSIPFFVNSIYNPPSILHTNAYTFILVIIYQLVFTALSEEIIFRGFIQSRLKGIIYNNILRILVVGVMFGLAHIPLLIISSDVSLLSLIEIILISIIKRTIMHIYFTFIYYKSNNLISPIIAHAINNILLL